MSEQRRFCRGSRGLWVPHAFCGRHQWKLSQEGLMDPVNWVPAGSGGQGRESLSLAPSSHPPSQAGLPTPAQVSSRSWWPLAVSRAGVCSKKAGSTKSHRPRARSGLLPASRFPKPPSDQVGFISAAHTVCSRPGPPVTKCHRPVGSNNSLEARCRGHGVGRAGSPEAALLGV